MQSDVAKTIKDSFEQVISPVIEDFTTSFFTNLFSTYPDFVDYFSKLDLQGQKKNFINTIEFFVEKSSDLDELGRNFFEFGKQHSDIEIKEEYCSKVGKCLVATLRHYFKSSWTMGLEEEWIKAFGFAADNLIAGSNFKAPSNVDPIRTVEIHNENNDQDLVRRVREIAGQVLINAMTDEMDSELMRMVRGHAKKLLLEAIKSEAEVLNSHMNRASENKINV